MKKILDHLFFLRPMLILPMWTVIILGVRAGELGEGVSPFAFGSIDTLDLNLLLLLLLSTLLYGAGYVYNQLNDIESDRENNKLFFLHDNIIGISSANILFVVLNLIGLISAFFLNSYLLIPFIIVLIMGILYSHPKINYKGRPGKALWSNMFGCGTLPFLIGWIYCGNLISMEALIKSTPYLLAVGAIYLNTTLPDREGDSKSGKNTFATIWTVSHTQMSSLGRAASALLLAVLVGDFAIFISLLLALPFYIKAAVSKNISDSVLATKVSILLLSLFACLYFPYYLGILIAVILGTRTYYRWRFDLAYPSLK
jgi:4-hydroxybenzoate polyprenyltransferase